MSLSNSSNKQIGLSLAALALMSLIACGGGGGASSSSGSSSSTDTTNSTDPVVTASDTSTTTIIDNSVSVVDTTPVYVDTGSSYDSGTSYDNGSSDSASGCDASGCNSFTGGGTKDTMLQRAKAQNISAEDRAQGLADRFDMSFQSAYQLAQLSDQVKAMSVQGQLTDKDRDAIATSAFAIGGVSTDDVKDAVTGFKNGDKSKAEALMDKAASKMGMSSSAQLRDQILPAVGVRF